MTNAKNPRALRDCVVVLLEDIHRRIALQLRDDLPGVGSRDQWGLFGGLMESGEEPAAAAIREVREELGAVLDPARLRFLRSFETESRPCVRLFMYPLGQELRGAVLREGQSYWLFPPEEIRAGVIGGKRVVLQHLAMMEWYLSHSQGLAPAVQGMLSFAPAADAVSTRNPATHVTQHPFHFAFFVRDVPSTRRFYGELLGCREGRSSEHWVDFDFFGNQISAHVSDAIPPTRNAAQVDGIAVPIPHFGCLVSEEEFHRLAERLEGAEVSFIIRPRVRFENQPGEQLTMFLRDFSGNAIEMKSFRNPEHVYTT